MELSDKGKMAIIRALLSDPDIQQEIGELIQEKLMSSDLVSFEGESNEDMELMHNILALTMEKIGAI